MTKYKHGPRTQGAPLVYVAGAAENSNNIGDNVVSWFYERGWNAIGDDCAVGDGSRPPGGNMPNDDVAEEHGYNRTDKGRYQRFAAPSVQDFAQAEPSALVITLGKTSKDHFTEAKDHDIENMIRANLTLPLEAARRFVQASTPGPGYAQDVSSSPLHIVFVGSYAHDHPFTNGTLYCAAKAALNMAARTLGWELTDYGFRVHVVNPYHVNGTPMWAQVEQDVMRSKGMTWEEADTYNRKDLKMPDLLTPQEVADVIGTVITTPSMGWVTGPINLYGGSR